MASNIVGSLTIDGTVTHFTTALTGEVLPKNTSDNKLITTTETSKTDELGEDDVFANENETSRGVGNFPKKNKKTAADNNQLSTKNENSQKVDNQISAVIISSPPQQETLTVSSINDANHVSAETTPPTSVVPTTRRPSYTSKAPSALTNLPKIEDINNASPPILQTYVTLHNSSSLPRGGSTSVFENEELRPINKDLLSLHGQASFDSVDHEEYSNPGTPPSISTTVSSGQRQREKSSNRMRADVLSKGKWEPAARSNVLTVRCREQIAELHKDKFGSGSKGKCIKVYLLHVFLGQ